MAPRAQWKGYLKLSLVSCPISLYPAVSAAEKVSFRQVNRETGHRLRQQLVDSVTGEVVESHNKGRGYEVGEHQFLDVQDEELQAARQEARTRPFAAAPEAPSQSSVTNRKQLAGTAQREVEPPRLGPALKLVRPQDEEEAPPRVSSPPVPRPIMENNHTIELDRFVRRDQVDVRFLNTPYYIAPRDEVGLEAFAVIRDAMASRGVVGMGRVVISNRERPIIVEPMGRGLRGITLRYAHEIRGEAEYFANIPALELPEDMVRITEHILDTKTEDFNTTYLEDRYRTVLVEKLREKQSQVRAKSPVAVPSRANVINLMDALKASLAAQQQNEPVPSSKKPRRPSAPSVKPPAPSIKRGGTKGIPAKARKQT